MTADEQASERMTVKAQVVASIEQAKLELERALAEMDAIATFDAPLLGIVAHALNNYITVTVATVDMLKMRLEVYPDPDVAAWLEGIGHAAELMQHSVSRLVSVSAPRDFPLKVDCVNLLVLMERACDYYRRRSTSGVRLTCRSTGPSALVRADRVALAVVADNLLSNAVQFSNRGGAVDVQVMTEPGHVVCSIRDSGPGLTPDQQARLFEQQPPADPPELTPGIGFGLAVAAAFIRRMDGQIWCESEPGSGACFSFRLPAFE
jgi:signal transduction histidine kinase